MAKLSVPGVCPRAAGIAVAKAKKTATEQAKAAVATETVRSIRGASSRVVRFSTRGGVNRVIMVHISTWIDRVVGEKAIHTYLTIPPNRSIASKNSAEKEIITKS